MEELIIALSNQGIGVVCVGFMIYFINTTMKQNNEILQKINENLILLSHRVDDIEEKLRKEE